MATFTRLTRDNLHLLKRGAYLDAKGRPTNRITEHGVSASLIDVEGRADVRFEIGAMIDGTRVHRHIGNKSASITIGQCARIIEEFR